MNTEPARHSMIYQQIRPWNVLADQVLETLARVPRERFVPAQFRNLAFVDTALPLPCGQSMLKPVVEGRLLQALDLQAHHRTLIVGTGSGYLAACAAKLSDHVTALDVHRELTEAASSRMADEHIRNTELLSMDFNDFDGTHGFDRILFTGSMPVFYARLPEWLKPEGKLLLITGTAPNMHVESFDRTENHYARTRLFETVVPPLENVTTIPAFHF